MRLTHASREESFTSVKASKKANEVVYLPWMLMRSYPSGGSLKRLTWLRIADAISSVIFGIFLRRTTLLLSGFSQILKINDHAEL